jgi:hypothetical protein
MGSFVHCLGFKTVLNVIQSRRITRNTVRVRATRLTQP